MKRLIVSVIVVVAFTFYAIFSRDSATQTLPTPGTQAAGTPGSASQNQTVTTAPSSGYADGTYTGSRADALYGIVQVRAVIEGGRIADIQILSHPTGRRSDEINERATPMLVQEAIVVQSADVQVVSGATLTSRAFMDSLQAALDQA